MLCVHIICLYTCCIVTFYHFLLFLWLPRPTAEEGQGRCQDSFWSVVSQSDYGRPNVGKPACVVLFEYLMFLDALMFWDIPGPWLISEIIDFLKFMSWTLCVYHQCWRFCNPEWSYCIFSSDHLPSFRSVLAFPALFLIDFLWITIGHLLDPFRIFLTAHCILLHFLQGHFQKVVSELGSQHSRI